MAKTTEARLRKVFEETGLTKEALDIILPKIEEMNRFGEKWVYIFRLWCGLSGQPPLTYEKIGDRFGISYQRSYQKVRRVIRVLKDTSWNEYRSK